MTWTAAWCVLKEQEGNGEHCGGCKFACMMQWSAKLDGAVAANAAVINHGGNM